MCEFYLVDSGLLSLDGSAVQFEKVVENSTEPSGVGLEPRGVGQARDRWVTVAWKSSGD